LIERGRRRKEKPSEEDHWASFHLLLREVNVAIQQGWQPHGSLLINSQQGDAIVVQPMVKYEENELPNAPNFPI